MTLKPHKKEMGELPQYLKNEITNFAPMETRS